MKRTYNGTAALLLILTLAACQLSANSEIAPTQLPATMLASGQPTSMPPVETSTPVRQASEQWRIVKEVQADHKPKYAAFMNELFGVTDCGENIQPSFTADGGQTWSRPVMGKFCPDSVDIVDGRNIWLCNSFGVFTSKDGGRSLSQLYSPYDGCRIISFADEAHGWSSFDWNVAATDDGAIRWLDLEKHYTMGDIAAVSRRTPTDGYVLTYDGTLFATTDGGANWTPMDLGIVSDDMRIANMDGRPPAAIQFQDEHNGVIILAMAGRSNTNFMALHTADGGQSWERHSLPLALGAIYLSHDGRFLTVTELGGQGRIVILENQAPN